MLISIIYANINSEFQNLRYFVNFNNVWKMYLKAHLSTALILQ